MLNTKCQVDEEGTYIEEVEFNIFNINLFTSFSVKVVETNQWSKCGQIGKIGNEKQRLQFISLVCLVKTKT